MGQEPWDRLLADVGRVACQACEEVHRAPVCDVFRWHRKPFVPRVVDATLPEDGRL